MTLKALLQRDRDRRTTLITGQVTPEPGRCVQCGICTYYCPINIDVRRHAWQGRPVQESHCLTCGECVARCPRDVLHFERIEMFVQAPGAAAVPGT